MKPFKQYAFAPLVGGKGFGVSAKDQRAYAQALGFTLDHPGTSRYAVAKYLQETVCADQDIKALEARLRRWCKLPHWRSYLRE